MPTFNVLAYDGGNSQNILISNSQTMNTNGNLFVDGALSFPDTLLVDLSIPDVQLQTDTNAYTFNCPNNMTLLGLRLNLDTHGTSGNVTVTVSSGATTMITLSIVNTDTSATTQTVTSGNRTQGDPIVFKITATPSTNTSGLRAALEFRRTLG